MNKIFFTPGPSALYFTAEQHIKEAIKNDILSISHRSKQYIKIHEETVNALKQLLNLPDGYQIGFTSSATEIWERIAENLIGENSYHFVNGSFSEKFHQTAQSLGKNAILNEVEPGTNHDLSKVVIPDEVELIGLAQNETSTGAMLPVADIEELRSRNLDKLLAIDSVSSLPVTNYDFSKLDTLYFSVQKCFGLPAGLGVWIYNERCLEKARQLQANGVYHDTYNSLLSIDKFAQKHQTSCTPNVLNIYLLGKVVQDMLTKGLDQIRQETAYKSALIYNLFENHEKLTPFVKEKKFRSLTIGVAEVAGGTDKLMEALGAKGLQVGSGYSQFKGKQIRIANFPTHSKEQMELLVDTINGLDF
ncbi:aminotransferase class V-fold PLP-dependent enzyme [Reichenbachiella agarivorans]|uniref:phosphoserine transaminase n=1 Tax=Reichenbachiella agarivorans TaxID=2979464 RepID=A0ABY6CTY6_9BACT|nr:aminotransferase class V-fold PLP-dependent enzyme [Reichenbachiella agarivorans]UXP31710.1 aminotransferase class V-fold PLP-dependent enzyme [Reichenbachiella agarivorans]